VKLNKKVHWGWLDGQLARISHTIFA
jgi:hypothetical protein